MRWDGARNLHDVGGAPLQPSGITRSGAGILMHLGP